MNKNKYEKEINSIEEKIIHVVNDFHGI